MKLCFAAELVHVMLWYMVPQRAAMQSNRVLSHGAKEAAVAISKVANAMFRRQKQCRRHLLLTRCTHGTHGRGSKTVCIGMRVNSLNTCAVTQHHEPATDHLNLGQAALLCLLDLAAQLLLKVAHLCLQGMNYILHTQHALQQHIRMESRARQLRKSRNCMRILQADQAGRHVTD